MSSRYKVTAFFLFEVAEWGYQLSHIELFSVCLFVTLGINNGKTKYPSYFLIGLKSWPAERQVHNFEFLSSSDMVVALGLSQFYIATKTNFDKLCLEMNKTSHVGHSILTEQTNNNEFD